MKIRFRKLFLIPLALGVLVSSCKDNDPKVKEVTSVKIAKASPEERAAALGSVSMIPSGSSYVLSIYDIESMVRDARATHTGALVLSLINEKFGDNTINHADAEAAETKVDADSLMEGESKDVAVSKDESRPDFPADLKNVDVPVKDVVISLGSKQSEFLELLAPLVFACSSMNNASLVMLMGSDFLKDDSEKDLLVDKVEQFRLKIISESLVKMIEGLDLSPSQGTAPFLAIATLSPDVKEKVEQTIAQTSAMAGMFSQGMLAFHSVKAAGLDFKGVVIDGKQCSKQLDGVIAAQQNDSIKKALSKAKEKLSSCKLYVLTAFKGNQLISVICTNPETQIRLAASPGESVLAQDDFSFVDAHLKCDLLGISYMSQEMVKTIVSNTSLNMRASNKGYEEGVRQTAPAFGVQPEASNSICSSIDQFSSSYGKLLSMANTNVAVTGVAWKENGVKINIAGGLDSFWDWNGAEALSGVNPEALPGTALAGFFSLTPELMQQYYLMAGNAGSALWKVASALMESPNAEVSPEIRMYYDKIKLIEPELIKGWQAMGLYASSISGKKAIAVKLDGDMPKCVSPTYQGGKIPVIAVVEKLSDRKKLDEAWVLFKQAADEVAPKLGGNVSLEKNMILSHEGNSYWYALKENSDKNQVTPVVTIDDSLLVLGSSRDWNKSVFKAAGVSKSDNKTACGLYVHVPSWIHFINNWITLKCQKEAKDTVQVLDALSHDLDSINYSVSKEGDRMIQKIEFKNAQ